MPVSKPKLSAAAAAVVCIGLSCSFASSAKAGPVPYPNVGTYNNTTYTFTAPTDGDVIGYFAGFGGAMYEDDIGLLVNGKLTSAGYLIDNHASYLGESFDFGTVATGDMLTFVMDNMTLGLFAYSNPALNGGYDGAGVNHIYSTAYTSGGGLSAYVPSGTYVGFEDLPPAVSDFNYNDDSFVFVVVPEPSSVALFVTALLAFGLICRQLLRGTSGADRLR